MAVKYKYQDCHLEILAPMKWGEWKKLGAITGGMVRSNPWWLADWTNYGEAEYGEKYAQALDVTGLSPERLRVISWVGNRYRPVRRRPALSFEAHRELAYVDNNLEQDKLLDKAILNGWGAKEIRTWKQEQRGVRPGPGTNVILATFSFENDVVADEEFENLKLALLEVADELACAVKFSRPKVSD